MYVPGVGMRVSVNNFFDRDAVKSALSAMDLKALSKASMIVRDTAKRSIKKKGMARLPRKVTSTYPGVSARALRDRKIISNRLYKLIDSEVTKMRFGVIQPPPSSPVGTPPYTHTPYSGHQSSYLGFRRNLWNFYDHQTHTAVAGPSRKGRMIPYLHEFGGRASLQSWVFIPQNETKSGGMKNPIIMKLPAGQEPRHSERWMPIGNRRSAAYPARPFMAPAMNKCIGNGSLARAFQGTFRGTQGPSAGFTLRRG